MTKDPEARVRLPLPPHKGGVVKWYDAGRCRGSSVVEPEPTHRVGSKVAGSSPAPRRCQPESGFIRPPRRAAPGQYRVPPPTGGGRGLAKFCRDLV